MWEVEFTDEFGEWFEDELTPAQQDSMAAAVQVLAVVGPSLGRPQVDTIKGSKHDHMKELRVQSGGEPFRCFFAFDPRRTAILLIGGNKSGDKRFYEKMIPLADQLYDDYIKEIRKEGLI